MNDAKAQGYFLGVDGGGTKTHYALFDAAGELAAFQSGGPSNHESYAEGFAGAARELRASLGLLLSRAGIEPRDVRAAALGLGGVDVEAQARVYADFFRGLGFGQVETMNDAFLGVKAGCSEGWGICLINGTGTCVAGVSRDGRRLQVGGTGYSYGDEAGGSWLGSQVLRAVYDMHFRGGPETALSKLLFDVLGIEKPEALVEAMYAGVTIEAMHGNGPRDADFCPLLFRATDALDPVATAILRNGARQMAASVLGCWRLLGLDREPSVEVVLAGSVNLKPTNPVLRTELIRAIVEATEGRARLIVLEAPPVAGAAIAAMEAAGLAPGDALRGKIRDQLGRIIQEAVEHA